MLALTLKGENLGEKVVGVTSAISRRPAPPRPKQAIAFARRGGVHVKALGSFLPALTSKAFEKFGFSTASLITDWPAIVGKELALFSSPERLRWPPTSRSGQDDGDNFPGKRKGATLVLRVDGARALDVQYKSRQVLERINAYFGYAAVAELRIVQAPLPAPPMAERSAVRAPTAERQAQVAGIADAALRDALCRLGSHLR